MPGRRTICCAVTFIFLAAAAVPGSPAATYRNLSLDALVDNSDYIVHARVLGTRAQWDPATRTIWTRTELLVLDGPKGRPGTWLAITEPGGILAGRGELYPGTPQFQAGQEVILFLYRAPGNRLRVTGMLQGVYSVTNDPQTGERYVVPAVARTEVAYADNSRPVQAARQSFPGRENLGRFLSNIRQRAATR